ncbi:hypothetical protein Pth03_25090 [Planotetraspora thailandica]|uniref:MEDS domain-containing protein n=1 Tax=Planotetraspora thailandica TaxID=487172 RepID=A0A8J3VBR4_9ACTN|nr:sensor histidine kinase [Planotetraspora thailandica]GII54120.1 hypothetical protein Pth03_25090 [Planotetraspora thailandica]
MIHQACLYGSDEEFLGMAVPFVLDGLAGGEPVLVTTTSRNLELLGETLGDDAGRVDHAETAYFGRRPAQRVTAFVRYWRRNSGRGRVRVLAEPVWQGRSTRDVLAWTRMESALNLLLAGTGIWMICPYDTRTAGAGVAGNALRTHPLVGSDGRIGRPCPGYAEPLAFLGECDAEPLPAVPYGAAGSDITDLSDVRRFVGGQARQRGLSEERAALLAVAAHEAARYLGAPLTASVWESFGALVCDLRRAGAPYAMDPLAGFLPPGPDERPGDGLWVARQLCDHVDMRSAGAKCLVRLQVAGPRLQEGQ